MKKSQEKSGKTRKEQRLWVGSRPHTLETVLPEQTRASKLSRKTGQVEVSSHKNIIIIREIKIKPKGSQLALN